MEKVTVNGILYEIEYQPNLSNNDYTKHHVYFIKTKNENYPLSYRKITAIMNDGSWNEGLYLIKNKQNPSMENALHPYHKFSYDEHKDVYVYTLVTPYDD